MFGTSADQSNWNPKFFEQGGLFEVFHLWSDWFLLHPFAFPDLDAVSRLVSERAVAPSVSGGGFPIRFVRQQRIMRHQREDLGWRANYQMRIFLSGEVPSRPAHWHDFFNALTWCYVPRVKAAINARHFHCIDETQDFPWMLSGGNRNREQDMLTLFDEGGLLVVTDDDEMWELIVKRDWQQLFLQHADTLADKVRFVPVGHALFECALKGHPRLHASCVRVKMDVSRLAFSNAVDWSSSLAAIDERAALEMKRRTHLRSPDDLHALPIWGIPGWHPRAGDAEFYSDSTHFR